MEIDFVGKLHRDHNDIRDILITNEELSLATDSDNSFRKVLLVAAGSRFEKLMTDAVLEFASEILSRHHPITHLVDKKGVKRQFHTWFAWNTRNANQFFALFGKEFQNHMKEKIENDVELDNSIKAFLEIGDGRNRLVHGDFASCVLEKTPDEIFELYSRAKLFVGKFEEEIRKFDAWKQEESYDQ